MSKIDDLINDNLKKLPLNLNDKIKSKLYDALVVFDDETDRASFSFDIIHYESGAPVVGMRSNAQLSSALFDCYNLFHSRLITNSFTEHLDSITFLDFNPDFPIFNAIIKISNNLLFVIEYSLINRLLETFVPAFERCVMEIRSVLNIKDKEDIIFFKRKFTNSNVLNINDFKYNMKISDQSHSEELSNLLNTITGIQYAGIVDRHNNLSSVKGPEIISNKYFDIAKYLYDYSSRRLSPVSRINDLKQISFQSFPFLHLINPVYDRMFLTSVNSLKTTEYRFRYQFEDHLKKFNYHFHHKKSIDKTILIVGDDQTNNAAIKILDIHKYKTKTTTAPDTVLDIVSQTPPNLILIDVDLEGKLSGYDLCRTLKTHNTTKTIKVALMSTIIDKNKTIKAYQNFADDFINNPLSQIFDEEIFEYKIKTLLKELV